jgi:hypothetical protein
MKYYQPTGYASLFRNPVQRQIAQSQLRNADYRRLQNMTAALLPAQLAFIDWFTRYRHCFPRNDKYSRILPRAEKIMRLCQPNQ